MRILKRLLYMAITVSVAPLLFFTDLGSKLMTSLDIKTILYGDQGKYQSTTVFKWQDQEGHWHFTDSPDSTQKNVDKMIVRTDANNLPTNWHGDSVVTTDAAANADILDEAGIPARNSDIGEINMEDPLSNLENIKAGLQVIKENAAQRQAVMQELNGR